MASRSRSFSMREWVRFALAASLLIAIVEYVRFASFVATGQGAAVARPDVADAFLPFGGLAALKVWLSTGFWDTLHPVALVVLVAILLTAWLFRRAPCSWLCPIGMATEYLGKLGKRITGGRQLTPPKWLDRTLIGLKYVLTVGIVVFFLSVPVEALRGFMVQPFWALSDYQLYTIYVTNLVFASFMILLVLGVSMFVRSAWCRYLCPYGALQGIFGILSPVVLKKNAETCTSCGRCNKVCINGVDVAGAKNRVTSAECMGCGTCIEECPSKGTLRFSIFGKMPLDTKSFGIMFLAVFAFVIMLAVVLGHWQTTLTTQQYRDLVVGGQTSGMQAPASAPQ